MRCTISKEELHERKNKVKDIIKKVSITLFKEDLESANEKIFWHFRVRQAQYILKIAKKIFGNRLAIAFSGGKDSLVTLHLALQTLGRDVPVIYNHTTVEFPETVRYVKELADSWGLNLHITKPNKSFFTAVKERGWATHENRWCCKPYKEKPAHDFILANNIIAEITGTVRTESIYRRSLKPFMFPKKNPYTIRVHPIYDWNQWEVWKYIRENNLPYNPLYDMGYKRIGCWCCPINGVSHYKRLKRTHPKLYSFLLKFTPTHPSILKLEGKED